MSKDFKISSSFYLYDKFNIAWIKKEATASQFTDQKAPFLAVILQSLEVSDGQAQKSVDVTLRDLTGTIQGNILHNLYQVHATHFTPGSVLILTKFGVLSCSCDKCDNHHLTITPKNLCAIYSGQEKIVIKNVNPQEVLSDFCQRNKKGVAPKVRNWDSVNRNTPSNSPVSSRDLMFDSRAGFQRPCSNESVCSNSINSSYSIPQKNSNTVGNTEGFYLPKIKSITGNNEKDSRVSNINSATRITNSKPRKIFSFKKIPLPDLIDSSSQSDGVNSSISSLNYTRCSSSRSLAKDAERKSPVTHIVSCASSPAEPQFRGYPPSNNEYLEHIGGDDRDFIERQLEDPGGKNIENKTTSCYKRSQTFSFKKLPVNINSASRVTNSKIFNFRKIPVSDMSGSSSLSGGVNSLISSLNYTSCSNSSFAKDDERKSPGSINAMSCDSSPTEPQFRSPCSSKSVYSHIANSNVSDMNFISNNKYSKHIGCDYSDFVERQLEDPEGRDIDDKTTSCYNKPQTFSFKQLPGMSNNNIIGSVDSDNSVSICGSQGSIRIESSEHEKLWKDVLDNVDLNSFFNEDF